MSAIKPTPRLRGRAGVKQRQRRLAMFPLCANCEAKGKIVATDEIDHIIPLCKGGSDDDSNVQGLCAPCHDAKTRADLGQQERVTIGVDGWPIG